MKSSNDNTVGGRGIGRNRRKRVTKRRGGGSSKEKQPIKGEGRKKFSPIPSVGKKEVLFKEIF